MPVIWHVKSEQLFYDEEYEFAYESGKPSRSKKKILKQYIVIDRCGHIYQEN